VTELTNFRQRINDLNDQVVEFVRAIPVEGLNWRPPFGEMNSLAALASHIAGAQQFWILEGIGEEPRTRNRDKELRVVASSSTSLVESISKIFTAVQSVLERLEEPDLDTIRTVDGHKVPVRWGLIHVVEHTSLHLGHIQVTYQLWSQGDCKPTPFWQERFSAS
jgi:uncharacterized damage-inducible protein DinB